MDPAQRDRPATEELRQQIAATEAELHRLKTQLADAENQEQTRNTEVHWKWPLQEIEYERYARQLILPSIGTQGQLLLNSSSVLIIGAGGLGCPAAAYLAGAGVGHIGVVDGDTVETSNLHRQIGHSTERVGSSKARSLVVYLRSLNNLPTYTAHEEAFTPSNALGIVNSYSVVLDCTDHPAVRYLISDACIIAGKPLVSAAALRTDGQLAILNWPVGVGPCYRCVFPRPPPQATQVSCAEGGILGPVVGVMGVLQALETIRVITSQTTDSVSREHPPQTHSSLLLFSAAGGGGQLMAPNFRAVRLRGRRPDCFSCSGESSLQKLHEASEGHSGDGWPDYVQFCSSDTGLGEASLRRDERISAQGFANIISESIPHWLIDVREKEFYSMGSIDGSVNIPFSKIQSALSRPAKKHVAEEAVRKGSEEPSQAADWLPKAIANDKAPIYLICRVGNDSQIATRCLKDMGISNHGKRLIADIEGGISAWKRDVDRTIPFV